MRLDHLGINLSLVPMLNVTSLDMGWVRDGLGGGYSIPRDKHGLLLLAGGTHHLQPQPRFLPVEPTEVSNCFTVEDDGETPTSSD